MPSIPSKTIWNANLNVSYIHALLDIAGSVDLLIAALMICQGCKWQIADPICIIIFSVVVSISTTGVFRGESSVG